MVSPYSTAVALARPAPTYINAKQQADLWRVQAYWTYDDIVSNAAEAFASLLRTDDDLKGRRYIPYARAVLEGRPPAHPGTPGGRYHRSGPRCI